MAPADWDCVIYAVALGRREVYNETPLAGLIGFRDEANWADYTLLCQLRGQGAKQPACCSLTLDMLPHQVWHTVGRGKVASLALWSWCDRSAPMCTPRQMPVKIYATDCLSGCLSSALCHAECRNGVAGMKDWAVACGCCLEPEEVCYVPLATSHQVAWLADTYRRELSS